MNPAVMDSWLAPKTEMPASARMLNRFSGSQLKLKEYIGIKIGHSYVSVYQVTVSYQYQ